MGRMDSPSLLSSSRKQFASVSAAVHFRPVISLRRQLVSASWQMMKAPLCNPCLRNELAPFSQEGHTTWNKTANRARMSFAV